MSESNREIAERILTTQLDAISFSNFDNEVRDLIVKALDAKDRERDAYREVAINLSGRVDTGDIWDTEEVDAQAKRILEGE